MAEIKLVRIDQRMVHGQVAVKWVAASKATKIVCVDDEIAANEMMKKVYKAVAPAGTKVLVYSVDRCIEKWNETNFKEGNVMMLFKTVDTAYRTFKAGFPLKELHLGNAPRSDKAPLMLGNEFFVSEDGLAKLREMAAAGVKIEVRTIPEQGVIPFESASANL